MDFAAIFPDLPDDLAGRLQQSYEEIKRNFIEGKFEPSELNGAKFCEIVYRILEWLTSSSHRYTPFGNRITNFSMSLKKFESFSSFPDSVRFHIPKILDSLYFIRNKRGVGHTGGDVDPNFMDASFVVSSVDWVLAELVRLLHDMKPEAAQALVQGLVTRKLPVIWEVDGLKRVLEKSLTFTEKTLLLLYSEYPRSVNGDALIKWVEHSNVTIFRRDILRPAHKNRLIEFDEDKNSVTLSPRGAKRVEDVIIPKITK